MITTAAEALPLGCPVLGDGRVKAAPDRLAGGLSLPNLARAVAAVPLILVLLYVPFRMGMQINGGLDPNQTVNAWGGPTYLGALLAHYLDCVIGFYAAAFLLSRLLLPAADADRSFCTRRRVTFLGTRLLLGGPHRLGAVRYRHSECVEQVRDERVVTT